MDLLHIFILGKHVSLLTCPAYLLQLGANLSNMDQEKKGKENMQRPLGPQMPKIPDNSSEDDNSKGLSSRGMETRTKQETEKLKRRIKPELCITLYLKTQ